MRKIVLFFSLLLVASVGFADSIVLNNQAASPTNNQQSRVAIQWASSVKEVAESNSRIKQGAQLDLNSLHVLTQVGKINLEIPKNSEYFRMLVWSKGVGEPDLLTNWVDIIPNKTYTLTKEHLSPIALMSGMGC